jgi:hypothetical protein
MDRQKGKGTGGMVNGIIQEVNLDGAETSSGRPQDALLADMVLPHREVFYPLGYPVEFITNDTSVLEAAQESFGHRLPRQTSITTQIRIGVTSGGGFRCPQEPTRREYNHLFSLVADVDNQAQLDLRSGANFTWVTRATVQNRIYFRYNFLEKVTYLLLGASVVTDLHAACVSKNGYGILLVGDSGAGKSTLAYACARAGWTYTSDDTSYLINDAKVPRVIGHSHRARFRPSAKSLFPELERFGLTPRMEGKPSIEVPISELPVARTATEAAVDCIVYLNRRPAATASLVRLPNGTASELACGELYSAGEIREKHEKILKILSDIPTYQFQYCDLSDGIAVLDLLSQSR